MIHGGGGDGVEGSGDGEGGGGGGDGHDGRDPVHVRVQCRSERALRDDCAPRDGGLRDGGLRDGALRDGRRGGDVRPFVFLFKYDY